MSSLKPTHLLHMSQKYQALALASIKCRNVSWQASQRPYDLRPNVLVSVLVKGKQLIKGKGKQLKDNNPMLEAVQLIYKPT
jgi:hypothetical protein